MLQATQYPNTSGQRSYQEPSLDTEKEMVARIVLSVVSTMVNQEVRR